MAEFLDTHGLNTYHQGVKALINGAVPIKLTQAEYDALPNSKYTDGKVYFITDRNDELVDEFLTQAQYDALPNSKYTDGKVYFITDRGIGNETASHIVYDNSTSGLDATNVQDAIDEIWDECSSSKFPASDGTIREQTLYSNFDYNHGYYPLKNLNLSNNYSFSFSEQKILDYPITISRHGIRVSTRFSKSINTPPTYNNEVINSSGGLRLFLNLENGDTIPLAENFYFNNTLIGNTSAGNNTLIYFCYDSGLIDVSKLIGQKIVGYDLQVNGTLLDNERSTLSAVFTSNVSYIFDIYGLQY